MSDKTNFAPPPPTTHTNAAYSPIFYGAGRVLSGYLRIAKTKSIVPCCIVDGDVKKHHKMYPIDDTQWGQFEVLPLGEAIAKFPNYGIYVSLERKTEIYDFLITKGVQRERLKTFSGTLEWCRDCPYLWESATLAYGNGEMNP